MKKLDVGGKKDVKRRMWWMWNKIFGACLLQKEGPILDSEGDGAPVMWEKRRQTGVVRNVAVNMLDLVNFLPMADFTVGTPVFLRKAEHWNLLFMAIVPSGLQSSSLKPRENGLQGSHLWVSVWNWWDWTSCPRLLALTCALEGGSEEKERAREASQTSENGRPITVAA